MKKFTPLLLFLLAAPSLHAMTWQELEAEIRAVEAGEPPSLGVISRFGEIVQMLVTYNRAVQEASPGSQLFCPAPNGSMQIDEVVSMVRAAARNESVTGATLVQSLMLESFRQRFPC